jgi:hypothetical protein
MTDSALALGGLEALTDRVERGKRRVPPPRHPRPASQPTQKPPDPVQEIPKSKITVESQAIQKSAPAPAKIAPTPLLQALADAPTTMLGARVRRPLDDLLADAVHSARQHQVRTSKVELVELALLSLADLDGATLAERVRRFRSETSRYAAPRR